MRLTPPATSGSVFARCARRFFLRSVLHGRAARSAAARGLTIKGVGVNPTRTGLLDILALMGADLRVVNHRSAGAEPVADIEVRPARLRGIHVPEHLVPLAIDEFPALFVAAACADGETVVTGAEELRVKESDRIAVMAEGLEALGVECEVLPDGIRIQGRPSGAAFSGGEIDSHGDHRIAMSFAVASLRAQAAIQILRRGQCRYVFPDFPGVARAAGLDVRVGRVMASGAATPIITIDGPSGSGKGTVSRRVADRLGWRLLDSGALYRLVAYAGQQRRVALGGRGRSCQDRPRPGCRLWPGVGRRRGDLAGRRRSQSSDPDGTGGRGRVPRGCHARRARGAG